MFSSKKQLFTKEVSHSLKGLMAMIIMASHLSLCDGVSHPLLTFANKMATTAVALFFFISGYGLSKSLLNSRTGAFQFFASRGWVILKTMLYITLLFVALNSWDTSSVPSLWIMTKNLITHGHTPLPNSWFIFVLLALFACYYLALKITSKKAYIVAILYILSIGLTLWAILLNYGREWWVTNLAFGTGVLFCFYEKSFLRLFSSRLFITTSLIAIATILYTKVVYLFPLAYIPIIWICLTLIYHVGFPFTQKPFKWLGDISFEIYLIHGALIVLLRGQHIYIQNSGLYALSVLVGTLLLAFSFYKGKKYLP